MAHRASIYLNDDKQIGHITLSGDTLPSLRPDGVALRFLSIVEVARIPLHLVTGSPYAVHTDDVDTETWFSRVLLGENERNTWWQTAQPESPLGILVSIPEAVSGSKQAPPVTELLFYATSHAPESSLSIGSKSQLQQQSRSAACPALTVNAIALSSHLLHVSQNTEPTPPVSPGRPDKIEAEFLPPLFSPTEDVVVNEPPVRKRRSAVDAFDEASERRKKARRRGGESVAAAAAAPPRSESQIPNLKHGRSASNGQPVSLQTRTFSRSPSLISSRPNTAGASAPHRSSLSRVQSAAAISNDTTVESKNKELISRIVMAGMRLYGLCQKKNRKSHSDAPVFPAVDASNEQLEHDRRQDEEYKLVYHQTFRGACVAFRATVNAQDLYPVSEAVRDVVDQLLAIFCNNPLAHGLVSTKDKLTPGGRKAFGFG